MLAFEYIPLLFNGFLGRVSFFIQLRIDGLGTGKINLHLFFVNAAKDVLFHVAIAVLDQFIRTNYAQRGLDDTVSINLIIKKKKMKALSSFPSFLIILVYSCKYNNMSTKSIILASISTDSDDYTA